MTGNEIIKAWEKILSTGDAPIGEHWSCGGVVTTLLAKVTLDMLNRQKTEVSALKSDLILKTNDYEHLKKEYEKAKDVSVGRKDRLMQTVVKLQTSKAEIEQWKEEANRYQNLWCEAVKDIQTAKSEAIKEFAERYEKAVLPLLTSATLDKKDGIHACLDILKEMVGDDNATH